MELADFYEAKTAFYHSVKGQQEMLSLGLLQSHLKVVSLPSVSFMVTSEQFRFPSSMLQDVDIIEGG